MKKHGYTLQDQIDDVTKDYADQIGGLLAEHGFAYRYDVNMTTQGMRFVFESCINGDWPDGPIPKKWKHGRGGNMISPPFPGESND